MAKISQQTIDLVKRTADIVDVVSEVVKLQPSGKNLTGLCPFHSEKTPSFFVHKDSGLFNCYGCHEKGDAIHFVQKYKNISYPEAIAELAHRYHIEIETEGGDEYHIKSDLKRPYELNEAANAFYQVNLTNMERGKVALDYIRGRGLDVHTIQYFELGYAPQERSVLFQELKSTYEPVEMMELGLINKGGKDYYDLFRHRLIFPIRNEQGKLVAFSGRILEKNENEAKYVNTPQTKLFVKSQVLYNLDKALPFIRRQKRVVLFEGYLDVIAAFQAGVKEGVCSMGTALTEEQARLIKKHTDQAVLCYDGDSAGFEAMVTGIRVLENAGLVVGVVLLPEGLDPDEFVRKKSKAAFASYLENHVIDPVEFEYEVTKRKFDLTKPSQVEEFKAQLFKSLERRGSQTLLEFYIKKLTQDLSVDESVIRSDMHHHQITQAILASNKRKKEQIANIAILSKRIRAENRLLLYFVKKREFRIPIIDALTPMFVKENLNVSILVEAEAILAKDNSLEDITELVVKAFTKESERTMVRQRLEEGIGDFSDVDLAQLIHSVNISKLEDEVLALQKDRELAPTQEEFMNISKQIQALLIRIQELKKENPWKKPKS
ncbi:MAG: DNA primase [Candidatus Izemoplasmatales bacterium]|nr:DNA primase [Candidatus Izemoplasmatales bacterium]